MCGIILILHEYKYEGKDENKKKRRRAQKINKLSCQKVKSNKDIKTVHTFK